MTVETSPLGLGTAALAIPYGAPGGEREPPDPAAAVRTIQAAVEAGVTLIDTAPAYGDAERLVGRAVGGRDDVQVATKLAIPPQGWAALGGDLDTWVLDSVHASLRALGRERVEILQVHNADAELARGGAVRAALDELRSEGLIVESGATTYTEPDALAVIAGGFGWVQVPLSALDRRAEREAVPAAARNGVGVVARSTLLRGVLTAAALSLPAPYAPLREAVERFRAALGSSWEDLPGAAVAFVAALPGVQSALLGTRDEAELHDLLRGAERYAGRAAELLGEDFGAPAELLDPRSWTAD